MTEMISKSATAADTLGSSVTNLRAGSAYVTQSRFFSPVFNAAIFDGPIRIYFSQSQEALALKVYFEVQERYADLRRQSRGLHAVNESLRKPTAPNVFVMLYPTVEVFDLAFGASEPVQAEGINVCRLASEPLGDDFVLGVRGPMTDETVSALLTEMDSILRAPAI